MRTPIFPTNPIPLPAPLTRLALANWVRDTCLLFGADVTTAFLVAGEFVREFSDS